MCATGVLVRSPPKMQVSEKVTLSLGSARKEVGGKLIGGERSHPRIGRGS